MPWTERQRLMLEHMGLRIWSQPEQAHPAALVAKPPGLAPASQTSRSAPTAPTASTTPSVSGIAPVRAPHQAPHAGPTAPRSEPLARPPTPAHPATSWGALREAVADCRACGLCNGRRQTVFGAGHEHAHWMVVGEAPGEQEDLQGEPFVGPAGQLLDAMLRALNLSRAADGPPEQRVFIANTLKCRPPGNRNPQPDELAQCEPFLVRQIELVQPRIILAMGRFALHTLLRSNDAVGKLRGRVHHYQGVPLVATYHPAYLLRNPLDKAKSWADLCLAADTYEAAMLSTAGASIGITHQPR